MTDDGTPMTAAGRRLAMSIGGAWVADILAIEAEARALVTPTPRTEGLRAFIENVEIAAEDNGTKAVLIEDLWAFYRDWVRALVTPDPASEGSGTPEDPYRTAGSGVVATLRWLQIAMGFEAFRDVYATSEMRDVRDRIDKALYAFDQRADHAD